MVGAEWSTGKGKAKRPDLLDKEGWEDSTAG